MPSVSFAIPTEYPSVRSNRLSASPPVIRADFPVPLGI